MVAIQAYTLLYALVGVDTPEIDDMHSFSVSNYKRKGVPCAFSIIFILPMINPLIPIFFLK